MLGAALDELPQDGTLGLDFTSLDDAAIAIPGPDSAPRFACALERARRVKQDGRWPRLLLDALPWDRIAHVGVSGLPAAEGDALGAGNEIEDSPCPRPTGPFDPATIRYDERWEMLIAALPAPVAHFDHHAGHAASAWYGTDFDGGLVLTCDAAALQCPWTLAAFRGQDSDLSLLGGMRSRGYILPTHLYSLVTAPLGLTPNRQEGRVIGLAASGRYAADDLKKSQELAWLPAERVADLLRFDLAGGNPYAPTVADAGTALGATMLTHVRSRGRPLPRDARPTMYPDPPPAIGDVAGLLKSYGVSVTDAQDLTTAVAELRSTGGLVAVCRGAMEFGPQTLGHRITLAPATDPTVNDWLDTRRRRMESMPFAPTVLAAEVAGLLEPRVEPLRPSIRFMTTTANYTARFRALCPAVVHVDGTARPQVPHPGDDPFCERVLAGYAASTGVPALINTRFNVPEEPIVCTLEDALTAFAQTTLDAALAVAREEARSVTAQTAAAMARAQDTERRPRDLDAGLRDLHGRSWAALGRALGLIPARPADKSEP